MYKITLSSSSKNSLKIYTEFLNKICVKFNISYSIFNLPMTKKRITLLTSPHVNKKSKEHFEIRKHKVILSFDSCLESNLLKYLLLGKPKSVQLKLDF